MSVVGRDIQVEGFPRTAVAFLLATVLTVGLVGGVFIGRATVSPSQPVAATANEAALPLTGWTTQSAALRGEVTDAMNGLPVVVSTTTWASESASLRREIAKAMNRLTASSKARWATRSAALRQEIGQAMNRLLAGSNA